MYFFRSLIQGVRQKKNIFPLILPVEVVVKRIDNFPIVLLVVKLSSKTGNKKTRDKFSPRCQFTLKIDN